MKDSARQPENLNMLVYSPNPHNNKGWWGGSWETDTPCGRHTRMVGALGFESSSVAPQGMYQQEIRKERSGRART